MKLRINPSQRSMPEVQAHSSDTAPCKGHILVVEDNPGVLSATEIFLSENGYKVTTATSLPEAVERARTCPELDLLITDYHLSNKETGKQVIAAVRELRGPAFKAVVITGDTYAAVHAFDGDVGLCWLRKPIDPRQLVTVLDSFLARRPG
jgi:two-component system, sensor histidine kinase